MQNNIIKNAYLPINEENIKNAKQFLLLKWKERAFELGKKEPLDLSSSCKFSSLFTSKVFGGKIKGNWFHQWVEITDNSIIDLNESAKDVQSLKAKKLPEYLKHFQNIKCPENVYSHDKKQQTNPETLASFNSIEPRVNKWVKEFLNITT